MVTEAEDGMPLSFEAEVDDLENGREDSDYSLVEAMANREADPANAERALGIFFRRHLPRLLGGVAKCQNLGPTFDGDVMVADTLIRAYRHAGKFKCQPGLTPAQKDAMVFQWLYQILSNLIRDFHRARESFERARRAPSGFHSRRGLHRQMVEFRREVAYWRAFLRKCSPEDAEILRVGGQYFNETSGLCVIPEKPLQEICAKLGITAANLCTRRKRLLDKVKTYAVLCDLHLIPSPEVEEIDREDAGKGLPRLADGYPLTWERFYRQQPTSD